jgi:hypothetical protein
MIPEAIPAPHMRLSGAEAAAYRLEVASCLVTETSREMQQALRRNDFVSAGELAGDLEAHTAALVECLRDLDAELAEEVGA